MDALIFIVRTLFQLLIIAFLLRFVLQWIRADFRNPISQAVIRVTNPVVVPLRRIIPSWRRADLATLAAVFLIQVLASLVLSGIIGASPSVPALLLYSLKQLVITTLQMYTFIIFVYVLMSWINPGAYNPIVALLQSVAEPVLRPVRRMIPPIGGLDLTPLFVLIGIQAIILLIR